MVEHDPLEDMQPKTATAVLMRDNFLWIRRMQQDVAGIRVLKFINCDAGVPCRNGDVRRNCACTRDDSHAVKHVVTLCACRTCPRDLQIAFEKL